MPHLGSDIVYMVQLEDAPVGEAAKMLAEQTEGTYSIENELIDEQTKFGRRLGYGNNSESFEVTMYFDRSAGQNDILTAIKKKKRLKIWEVDLNKEESGEYPALFAYGLVESMEKGSETDSYVEYSGTIQVDGESAEGTLVEEDVQMPENATVAFETPGETGTETTT